MTVFLAILLVTVIVDGVLYQRKLGEVLALSALAIALTLAMLASYLDWMRPNPPTIELLPRMTSDL